MSESELGSAAVCNLERGVKIAVERAARVRERGNDDGRMVVGRGINRGGDIMSGFDHPPAGPQAGRAVSPGRGFFQKCRKCLKFFCQLSY